jgi:hypothetical protein
MMFAVITSTQWWKKLGEVIFNEFCNSKLRNVIVTFVFKENDNLICLKLVKFSQNSHHNIDP